MRKHRAFPGRGAEVEERYQRAGQWILATIYGHEKAETWCHKNGVPIKKAVGETIDSSGGYLVPIELSNAILDLRDYYGAFRRRARIVPMNRDTTNVARRSTTLATTGFLAENTAAATSLANVDNIALTTQKLGSLIQISSELAEDSITDMVDYLANEIAVAFAAQEDDCAFNGDGTSTYGKMRGIGTIVLDGFHNKAKVTAASGHNTFGNIDSTDLANLIAAIQAVAIPNAAWFCSQTCFSLTFLRLAGGTGYLPMAETDGILTPHYLGFPVILTQKLPLITSTLSGKVMLAFGDMYLAAALGQRRAITVARSADRYLDTDQIAILATERFHANVHDVGDNTNFGAIAALVGN